MAEDKSKVHVDRIPLKVKKPTNNNKDVKKKTKKKKNKIELPVLKEDKTSLQIFSTVKVITVLVLLAVTFVLIANIVLEIDKDKSVVLEPDDLKIEDKIGDVLGSWLTGNKSLFVFDKNSNFYWYDSYTDKTNNYYAGTFTYKTGLDALEEMGYTEEDLKVSFEDNIKVENVYSIIMTPKTVIKAHKDVSASELRERETWWFLIIKKDDGTAYGYNKTLDIRYNLTSQ